MNFVGKLLKWLMLFLVLLCVLLPLLLLTHTGNQVLIKASSELKLPLQLQLSSGTVFGKAHWHTISWQGQLLQLDISNLRYEFDWRKLVHGELALNYLRTGAVSFHMTLTDQPVSNLAGELATSAPWQLNIPVPININQIAINDIDVVIGNTRVTLAKLTGAVALLGRNIDVEQLGSEQLQVVVSTGPAKQAGPVYTAVTATPDLQPQLDKVASILGEYPLAQIDIPLQVEVKAAKLVDSALRINDLALQFDEITLAGKIDGGQVNIAKLQVAMPQARAEMVGDLLLQRDYPISAKLTAQINQPQLLQGVAVSMAATGSIEQLHLDLNTTGHITSQTKLQIASLTPDTPFHLTTRWQQLAWPLTGDADFTSKTGKVVMQGDRSDYSIDLNAELDGVDVPASSIAVISQGDDKQLQLKDIAIKTLQGVLRGKGLLQWHDGMSLTSQWQTKGITLIQQWPEVDMVPEGQFNIDFTMPEAHVDNNKSLDNSPARWSASVSDIALSADVAGFPLRLDGALAIDQDLHININNIVLARKTDKVTVNGSMNDDFKIGAEVNISDISPYLRNSTGSVFGYFSVIGKMDNPRANFELYADKLGYQDNSVERAELSGAISLAARPLGRVNFRADSIVVAGTDITALTANYSADAPPRGNIAFTLQAHNATEKLKFAIAGQWQGSKWQGRIVDGYINSGLGNWAIQPGVAISYASDTQQLLLPQHCWREDQARLCLGLDAKLAKAVELDFALHNYQVNKLSREVWQNAAIDGAVNASGHLSWHHAAPLRLDTSIAVTDGELQVFQAGRRNKARFDKFATRINLTDQNLFASIAVESTELGEMHSELTVKDIFNSAGLMGNMDIKALDLSFIEPLLNEVDTFNGIVSGKVDIAGQLTKPQLKGQIKLVNGYLAGKNIPFALDKFTLTLNAQGQVANVQGSANSGAGVVRVNGEINWSDGFDYQMTLTGNSVAFDDNKGMRVRLNPDLSLAGNLTGAKISGDIKVPYARIEVKQLPESAIQVSPDIIIIDAKQQQKRAAFALSLAVKVVLLDNVKIDSFGLQSNISGSVSIALGKQGSILADGILEFNKGRYRSFGQDLVIRKGQVIFSGAIDNPYLNVEAIRNPDVTADNVIVGIRLVGPVHKPIVSIFSEPNMTQTRTVSYLLRGRDVNQQDETSQDAMLMSMLVGASLGQGKGVINFVGDKLGVEDFAIDTAGQGDDTRVEISGYVLPGVQIRYGIGLFSALSEVAIRYEFLPQLYIEVITGIESAVDLYYKFSN